MEQDNFFELWTSSGILTEQKPGSLKFILEPIEFMVEYQLHTFSPGEF